MGSKYIRLNRPIVLATDLDGTFLGGTAKDKQTLYELIELNKEMLQLIFCTGRSYQNTIPLIQELGLPVPVGMVCDVGCAVTKPDGSPLFQDLQSDIAEAWGDGHQIIPSLLERIDDLSPQTNVGPYRRAYFYTDSASALEAKEIVEKAGFDGLISDNKYFDVLPKGVNKGATLKKLMSRMNVDPNSVLTAGDSLNDLSMFETDFSSVVVSNAEPALLARLPKTSNIYCSKREGAGGILEALARNFYDK
jgi:HAD superfamily hydrolase (TIGR01484 family)|uniref:HAD-IIB family hydrolase n=1 Tax=Polynucleobacter sp. TaxID=2029855 RepID=UPI0040488375